MSLDGKQEQICDLLVFNGSNMLIIEFKKDENTLFLVAGDATVPYEEVIKGIVLLKEAGIEKAGLMTQGQ